MLTAVFFYNSICNPVDTLCVSMRQFEHTWRNLQTRWRNTVTFTSMKCGFDEFSKIASELIKFDNKLTQVLASYIVRRRQTSSTTNDELRNIMAFFENPYMPLTWKNITNTLKSLTQ